MKPRGEAASRAVARAETMSLPRPLRSSGSPVVVTGVGGPAGIALSRQLVTRGIRVIGTDCRVVDVASVECRVVPTAHDPRFLEVLATIALEAQACLVIPTVSEELPVVASASPMTRR